MKKRITIHAACCKKIEEAQSSFLYIGNAYTQDLSLSFSATLEAKYIRHSFFQSPLLQKCDHLLSNHLYPLQTLELIEKESRYIRNSCADTATLFSKSSCSHSSKQYCQCWLQSVVFESSSRLKQYLHKLNSDNIVLSTDLALMVVF